MLILNNKITSKLSTLMVAFDAGSRVEGNSFNGGISHMLEHCIFKGTTNRDWFEIQREFAFIGARPNAFTSNEMVCYHVTVPYENLEIAADILSDIVFNSTIPEDEFLKEKEVVKEEEISRKDDVDGHMWGEFCKEWFTNHLANPVIGTQDSIDKFTRDEVDLFYNKYCDKKGAIVSLASCLNKRDSKRLLNKYFGKSTGRFRKNHSFNSSEFKDSRYIDISKDGIEHSYVWMAYPGIRTGSEYAASSHVLMSIFGSGMDSRLFTEVRERSGLVYGIGCSMQSFQDGSLCLVDFSSREHNVEKAIGIVDREVELIKKQKITSEELERAKNKIRSSVYSLNENSFGVAFSSLKSKFNSTPSIDEIMEKINSVTTSDVADVANIIFDKNKQLTMVCKNNN